MPLTLPVSLFRDPTDQSRQPHDAKKYKGAERQTSQYSCEAEREWGAGRRVRRRESWAEGWQPQSCEVPGETGMEGWGSRRLRALTSLSQSCGLGAVGLLQAGEERGPRTTPESLSPHGKYREKDA